MIVRILTEGQYRVPSSAFDRIDDLDEKLGEAAATGDRDAFERRLEDLISYVRNRGRLLGPDEIVESHLVLPAPDTTMAEARHLFHVKMA